MNRTLTTSDRPARRHAVVVPIDRARGRAVARSLRRRGDVPRRDLVAALTAASGVQLVLVVAPAGYGKTTLLAQWALADARPFGWVRGDALGGSLRCIDHAFEEAAWETAAARQSPFVLILDDADGLCDDGLPALLDALPPGACLALACRTPPPLPLGRLGAERRLLRVEEADLAFGEADAEALARGVGAELHEGQACRLVRDTEGWPAALALALTRGGRAEADAPIEVRGDDPALAGYLEELLRPLPARAVALLARSAALEAMSGPLCDAVLGRGTGAEVLGALGQAGLPVVRLDPAGASWRHHALVRDALRAELARREPGRASALHRRAAGWFGRNGDLDAAIGHAVAAGDADRVGALVWAGAPDRLGRGDVASLERWLAPVAPSVRAARAPLALATAWCEVERGSGAAEDWIASAERPGESAPAPAAAVALLRAAIGRDGPGRMRSDAALAFHAAPERSPWRALARLYEGIAHDLAGDRLEAARALEDGARRAGALLPVVAARCLARLAVLALDDEPARAARLVLRARELGARGRVPDCAPAAMVHPVCALVLVQAGRAAEARSDLRRGAALLHRDLAPWLAVDARVLLARAAVLAGDPAKARELLLAARALVPRGEGAVVLAARLTVAAEAAGGGAGVAATRDPLTTAEMRVLGYLPTHLSFPAIAGRLNVSRFTVKTQAMAVYRKLGASSRAEAVDRAREFGLLA